MSNDITDHIQTKEALLIAKQAAEASKAQYDLMVSMISDIVWRYDVNAKGEYIDSYISPVADRMLGLPEGTIGNNFDKYFSYVHTRDSQVAHGLFSELLRTPGRENSAQYRLLKADGTILWVCFKGSSYVQADGRVTAEGIISNITERRRSLEALADSEDRFHLLFEHMKHGVVIYESVGDGQDFVIKDINPAGERIEGVSKEDVVRRSVLDAFPGVKDFGLYDVFRRVLKTGNPEYYPVKYYKDDRIGGWRANYVSKLKSGEIVAVYDDLTEEKHAHEELQKTNAFLDSIIENIPDMIFIKDASELRFVRVNRSGEDFLGFSREELLGKNDYDFFPKEEADFFTSKDREVLAYNLKIDIPEELIHTRTKGTRVLHTKKISILDENGRPQYLLGICDDITERKRAEDALRNSEERYRSVVENATEGIAVVQDSRLQYANLRALQMFQASLEEIQDQPLNVFIHPDDRALVFDRYKRHLSGEDTAQNFDFRVVGKNGLLTWVQISVVRIMWNGKTATLNFLIDVTRRKMAEEALRNSEEQYRAFFSTSRDCVFITSVDGQWIDFNDTAVHFFGYDSREDLKRMRIKDLYANPDERILHTKAISKEGYTEECPIALRKKDGTIVDTLITSVTRKDSSGTIIGYQGTIRDITERKKAEEALRESKEQLMLAMEGSGVGLWDWRVQTGEVMFSERWAQIVGYTLQELAPISIETWRMLAHPDDLQRSDNLLAMHFAGELPSYECEVRMLHKDGHWVWILDRGKVVEWDKDGKPVRMTGTHLDVTERKRAEEALRESEELYRTVVSSATDGIILQESSGKVLTWNKAAERVFGIKSEDALNHTSTSRHWETIREDGSEFPEDEHPSSRTLETGEPCRNVVMGIRNAIPDQLSWISINTTPLFKEGVPKPYAVIISFSDITERKKFEDELENRVKERTEELESKAAEMERFIYTVSHDLRSPLVTVSGFVGFLEQDLKKGNLDQIQTDLRIIGESIRKMDCLLGDTLELSRIGRVANPPEDIPMGEIVQEALAQTAEKIRTRGIEVSVTPDMPVIHADRIRIVEVLVNLIENSVKYMGEEPYPHIDIGYRIDESETVFFVRDNGMGIDPSQHKNVFELFYQIDPKSAGTGAGLAIVKRIIEVHGGQIWIESELGKGCTVCFTLAA